MLYQLSYTPAQTASRSLNSRLRALASCDPFGKRDCFPTGQIVSWLKLSTLLFTGRRKARFTRRVDTGSVAISPWTREATAVATPTLRRQS